MYEARRAAWEAAIAKKERGEDVPPEEHYVLLRDGMFDGEVTPAVVEEADLFLRYWCDGLNRSPLPWLGPIIADNWFRLREWDQRWGRSYADEELRDYIAADDFDHWTALKKIAARLHRAREPFPEVLADWAADVVHEGEVDPPSRERGHKGGPPYAQEDRNQVFMMADNWLGYFGMGNKADRSAVIAQFADVDEDVVRKGLKRLKNDKWRRATGENASAACVVKRGILTPGLEWAAGAGQFHAAALTGLRDLVSSKRLGLR